MLSYNQIIGIIEKFAANHKQINEFANGDLWEVIEHNKLSEFNYPLLFIADNSADFGNGTFTLTFDFIVMDLVHKDESNENDVKSDTLQIINDVVAYFDRQQDYYTLSMERVGNAISFTERFDDELTGWKLTLRLKQPQEYDKCAIPTI